MQKKSYRKKIFTKKLLASLGIGAFVILGSNITFAKTWTINNYADLTAALQSAQIGDTLFLSNNITITDSNLFIISNKQLIIDGNGKHIIKNGYLKGISNLTWQNGYSGGDGGAIFVSNNFTGNITGSSFTGNTAVDSGGAIFVSNNFTGNITGSSFTGNTAVDSGGAIDVSNNFTGNITGSSFTGNTAGWYGGAIDVWEDFTGNITGSSFTGNTAGWYGGAISLWDFTGNIMDSSFTGNAVAGWSGGAIAVNNFTGNIMDSSFTGNTAGNYGGAIYVLSNFTGNITGSSFTGNTASNYGGAIYVSKNFTGNITGSSFTDNTADNYGGAIYVLSNFTGNITGSSFTGNTAGNYGGAIYVSKNFTGNITGSSFTDNTADNYGGAISLWDFTGNIMDSSFTGNAVASWSGGAIAVKNFTGNITGSSFTVNTAGNYGGAIFVSKNFTGNISGSSFTGNTATNDGGAIFVSKNFTGNITGSSFTGNTAVNYGGAIFVMYNSTIAVDSGSSAYFYDNKANGSPNSIHFNNNDSSSKATFNTYGSLFLYDPLFSDAGRKIPLYKNGNGLLLLGGNNRNIKEWNINQGNLLLTYDSSQNKAQITGSDDFALNSGAILQIVPDLDPANFNFAIINTTNPATLNGNTTVGSDYRYQAQLNITGNNKKLLEFTNGYTGAGNLINTSGSFNLGQYKYNYNNLHWNGNDLEFNITSSYLDPEVSGIYNANAHLRSTLANKTPELIFNRMQTAFEKVKVNNIPQLHLTTSQEAKEDLWGTVFYNQAMNKTDGVNAGSKAKVPGLILGKDEQISKNAFFGGAISASWPDYNQGNLKSTGKDIRVNLYGGFLLKSDWELGYLLSAGFGDLTQDRKVLGDKLTANPNTSNYTFGLSLAKDFHKDSNTTYRSFMTYEYVKSLSDGYTETGNPLLTNTASGQNNNLSRFRLGLQLHKQQPSGSYIRTSIYYQGLYGDTKARVHSYMNSNPGTSNVYMSCGSMNKNAIGLSLLWGKKLSEKLSFDISYDGTFGSRGMSNDFRCNFKWKF